MKMAPSKVLLVIGMGIYGYSLRAQIMGPTKLAAVAPAEKKELSALTVNQVVALDVPRDPFSGMPIKGGLARVKHVKLENTAAKPVGPMALQGVAVGEDVRTAIINGKLLREGEEQPLEEGGVPLCVKTVGVDYAVVNSGGRDVLLRLQDPKSKMQEPAAAKPRDPGAAQPFKEEDPAKIPRMVEQLTR